MESKYWSPCISALNVSVRRSFPPKWPGAGTWGRWHGEERVCWPWRVHEPGSDFLALCHSPAQLCLIFWLFFQKFQNVIQPAGLVMELDLSVLELACMELIRVYMRVDIEDETENWWIHFLKEHRERNPFLSLSLLPSLSSFHYFLWTHESWMLSSH